ncbi:MAG: hypothetical protein H8D94_01760 [Candidatus Pelagibacter sp.]|nr:hypothetical protein [Candidatus Pelagibacter sp.]
MAGNNQAQDRYNPPPMNQNDFESYKFVDIPIDELFWLNTSNRSSSNNAYRKINESEGMNTKTREIKSFDRHTPAFQKL